MLTVGDRVVYPMHGAGVIEAIEEHEIMGKTQQYFVLTMPCGGMRVMIPMMNVETIGLRGIIGKTEVDQVVDVLRQPPCTVQASWNRRFNVNLEKIKSGSIFLVAEVVRNLIIQDRLKKLSTGERRLLNTARQILVSELVFACDKEAGHIEEWLDGLLAENTPGN